MNIVDFASIRDAHVTVYKFHFTWIIIFIILLPIFRYYIAPWIEKVIERTGDKILNKFFDNLSKQIGLLKEEIKKEREKE